MRCLIIFVIALFTFAPSLQAISPSSSSRIVAVVNKNVITKGDLMNRLRFAAISSGLEPTKENLEQIQDQMLRVMIDENLQLELGKTYGLDIKKEHINAAIKDIEESNGMAPGGIAKILEANSIPLKTFEDQIKAQLTWLLFIQ
ncbi:MAG: SurA N-terminal domain-containing protein, partial [Alphaproteobacteria bacterium]|nr:SurA N-terminal domain-containing protein [Alphaproteobacteria bacterium]